MARKLAFMGVFAALVAVGTMFLRIPGPTGYYHLGDGMIYTAAILGGPLVGGLVGAVGSAAADMLGGYAVWAPWTLIIKGATGYVVGRLRGATLKQNLLAMLAGAVITIAGYAAATAIMYTPAAVVVEIYGNIGQTASGVVVALAAVSLLKRSFPGRWA